MKKLLFILFTTSVSVLASVIAVSYTMDNMHKCNCDESDVWPID